MRQRWLSRRVVFLHLCLLVWLPGCLVAFWWQVHRALGGNGLSYLYSVEWPVFALVGVWAWWQLLRTDPRAVGRRAQDHLPVPGSPAGGPATVTSAAALLAAPPVGRRREDEDGALAAYNDRLARLASEGPKTWRRR